jgi:hypothetical protein
MKLQNSFFNKELIFGKIFFLKTKHIRISNS